MRVKTIKVALLLSLFNHVTHPVGDKHIELNRHAKRLRKPLGANIAPANNRCLNTVFKGVASLGDICRCCSCH